MFAAVHILKLKVKPYEYTEKISVCSVCGLQNTNAYCYDCGTKMSIYDKVYVVDHSLESLCGEDMLLFYECECERDLEQYLQQTEKRKG